MLQLKYFFESAKNESFAKTAEKFMVPTTSVSASVKRLEQELGCRLFDRQSNRITLNANGKRMQQALCVVFAELEKAAGDIAAQSDDDREIKLLVRGMRRKITEQIIEYSKRNPQVRFDTVFDFSESDFENYDIVIDQKTDRYHEFERFELFSKRLRIKCAPNDAMLGKKLTLKQLCGRRFVSMGEESNLHKIMMNACARAGFTPDIAINCNDIECYERFISSGMGIAAGIEKSDLAMAESGMAYLDVVDFDERYTVYGYYKKKAYYGNVKSFLDFLKSASL